MQEKNLEHQIKQTEKEIRTLLQSFFNDSEKVELWLTTPNPNLGNCIPKNLIRLNRGHKVKLFIEAALEGY